VKVHQPSTAKLMGHSPGSRSNVSVPLGQPFQKVNLCESGPSGCNGGYNQLFLIASCCDCSNPRPELAVRYSGMGDVVNRLAIPLRRNLVDATQTQGLRLRASGSKVLALNGMRTEVGIKCAYYLLATTNDPRWKYRGGSARTDL